MSTFKIKIPNLDSFFLDEVLQMVKERKKLKKKKTKTKNN